MGFSLVSQIYPGVVFVPKPSVGHMLHVGWAGPALRQLLDGCSKPPPSRNPFPQLFPRMPSSCVSWDELELTCTQHVPAADVMLTVRDVLTHWGPTQRVQPCAAQV